MPLSLHDSKVTMYADDTSLAYASNSTDDITKSMNAELENLRKWLHGNKLRPRSHYSIFEQKRICLAPFLVLRSH